MNQYAAELAYEGTAPTPISGVFPLNVQVPAALTPGLAIVSLGNTGGFPYFGLSAVVTIAVK